MKKKSKIKIIDFLNMGCYPGTVLFSYQFSYDELLFQINKNYKSKRWTDEKPFWSIGISDDKSKIDNGNYFALYREIYNTKTKEEKHLYYIILKKEFLFTDWDYVMLSHEILHICQFFLPDILDRNKEIEAEAYLHSHLMQQCLKIIRTTV